ncbi:hypothetical protein [Helicobacter sp. 23-1045]
MQKFYFSIHSVNLADFLNSAIIENVVLREKRFAFNGDDVCLELVISESEKDNLKSLENGFFLYESALPLSRLRMIIFENKEQLEQTIGTIELTTAFVLRDMCVVLPLEKIHNLDIKTRESNADKLKEFDRYLGAMAFLRYNASGDKFLSCVFEYLDYFLRKSQMPFNEFEKIKPFLEGKMLIDDVRRYAVENGLTYKEKQLGKQFKQDDEILNILAQIALYAGDESPKRVVDMLGIEPYKLPSENKFYFALGYFVGYSRFANKERNKKIKFEFNKFDLTIIEIIYSFVWAHNLNKEIDDFIKDSRVFSGHFASLLFNKGNVERQILLELYNNAVSYTIEQTNLLNKKLLLKIDSLQNKLQEQIKELQEQNEKLLLKINSSQNELQKQIKELQEQNKNLILENENLKKDITALINKPKRKSSTKRSTKAKSPKEQTLLEIDSKND